MTGKLKSAAFGTLLLAIAVLGVAASASAGARTHPVLLKRCGYTKAEYGRSAVYPWHMTCAQARRVIAASDARHAQTVDFAYPGGDGGAIAIDGKFWVCTGQMGEYGCAYPWRPIPVDHQVGYTGPFTKGVMYETCSLYGPGGCGPTVPFTQPPS